MSTTPKPIPSAKPAMKPTTKSNQSAHPTSFLFDKENYVLMIGGVVLILIGFLLMAGGKSANPHEFNYQEVYSFRRITLAPLVILSGFGLEIYAIMKKPKAALVKE